MLIGEVSRCGEIWEKVFSKGEIVSVLDLEGPESVSTLAALRAAFQNSRQSIASEIHECRNANEFEGLQEDYELFGSSLGVDISDELGQIQKAYSELNDYEEHRADQMMDEYKGRYRESRVSEDSVRDMFASLRGDRED
ncbi:hypothetical protein NKI95_06555 [Mesorhizobium sp. M0306]|uniref:hypothetical protein n=1 Tax=Mesorhizobium sp. M0306 TaxID=2956932 RepID=UPI0033352AAD